MRMLVTLRERRCHLRGLLRLLVLATALACAATGSAQVNTYYVPWNATDATANIQNTINNAVSPSKIILTDQATPWYTSAPIQLNKSNMQIWFANGAKVMAKAGGHLGTADALFIVTGDSVKINGYYNGVDTSLGISTLEMRKTDYMSAPYAVSGSRHIINVRGAANTIIQGLHLFRSGGDGIALNPKTSNQQIPATNTTITDVTCDDNYRQGISVIAADTLTATNCVFKNTGLTGATLPTAGVDIEPSRAYDAIKAVKFVGCTFSGNGGNNVEINLHAHDEGIAPPIDVRFESCVVSGGAKNGMAFYGLDSTAGPTGTIVVKNTTITGTTLSGVLFSGWSADRIGVTMANVDIVNCSQGNNPPLLWTQTPNTVRHGDVVFQSGCHIHEDFTRTNALVYVGGTIQSGYGLKDVTGTIDYHRPANSTGPIMVLGTNTVNCTLTVTPAP